MFNKDYADEDYTEILKRIDSRKSYSSHDIDALSRQIIVSGNGNVVQMGGQNINIKNNSGYISIGSNFFINQGPSADALNKAIAQAIAMHRSNLGIPNPQVRDDGLVSFKFHFLLIWMLTSLLFASGVTVFLVQKNALHNVPLLYIAQLIFQQSIAIFLYQLFFGVLKFIYEMRHNEFQYRRVKHSYFHWCIYPIVIIVDFTCCMTKMMTKLVFQSTNSNIFKPFKWP